MNLQNFMKKSIRVSAFSILMILISLGLFEALLMVFSYEPNVKFYDYTLLLDRDLLFRIKPYCAKDINDIGYRGKHFNHEKSPLKKRVLFLGDSFVMGYNVPPGETIAASLVNSLGKGYEVFNMGVMAYGPDQSLAALLDHGLDYQPDMVILGVFAANDFQDIHRNKLYSLDGGGRLVRNAENTVTMNLARTRTFFLFDRLQYVLQDTIDKNNKFLSRHYEFMFNDLFNDYYDNELLVDADSPLSKTKIDLMRAILGQFDYELHQRDIAFAVVVIPSYLNIVDVTKFKDFGLEDHQYEDLIAEPESTFGPENIVVELCEFLDIPYVNLYPEFMDFEAEERAALYDAADWHLSASGNRFSGALVASELVKPRVAEPIWR